MKRFSMFAVGLLFVWMLLPAMAHAVDLSSIIPCTGANCPSCPGPLCPCTGPDCPNQYVFSTGPQMIQSCNSGTSSDPATVGQMCEVHNLVTKILNNNLVPVNVIVTVFRTNTTGTKTVVGSTADTIPAYSYKEYPRIIKGCQAFEVEVAVADSALAFFIAQNVLVSNFLMDNCNDWGIFKADDATRSLKSEMTVRAVKTP